MARRRRSAWGSVDYDPRRRVGHIRFWASLDDRGYRRHCVTVHGSRQDVENRRAELMLDHSDDEACPTMARVWEEYVMPDLMRQVEDGDVSKTTIDQYRNWWRKHVKPTWGDVTCDAVKPLSVQQWLYGLTRSQAANAMLVAKKVMDYAVRFGWAPTNPMREKYVMPGKSTVETRDKGIWTLAELEGVWRRVCGTWMEPAFILAAFGSCRVGEALAPLAGEVAAMDVDGVPVAAVTIARQVEHHGKAATDRMKTDHSRRTAIVVGRAATRLVELACEKDPSTPLTDDGMGGFVSQSRYTDNWRRMGMEHPFRNLRNSWQTWMRWEMGVAPHHIEPLMGHKLRGTTGQHYDRPQVEQLARVAAEAYARNPFDASWQLGNVG